MVEYSTDGGKTWNHVTDGEQAGKYTFDTATKWQKMDFGKEIANVTNVRLTALSTTGQTASQANQFASAAELRVTQYVAPEGSVVDKTGLQAAIDAVKALNAADYTEASWKVLQDKLAKAQEVYNNDKATAYDVTLAIANLQDAVKGLEAVPTPEKPDKTQLQQAVTEGSKLNASDYLAAGWEKYQQALENAKAVLANENATQADVQAALTALEIAKQGLVKAPDKSALQNAVNEYSKLDVNLYTAESWKNFQNAMEQAKAVLASGSATQSDVQTILDALNKAKAALVLKSTNSGNQGGSQGGGQTTQSPIVQTGDTSPVLPLFSLIGAAAAGIVALYRKKKEK